MKVWMVFKLGEYVFFENVFSTKEKAVSYVKEKHAHVEHSYHLHDYFVEQWEVDIEDGTNGPLDSEGIEGSCTHFYSPFYSLSEEDRSKFYDLSHDSKRELLAKEK